MTIMFDENIRAVWYTTFDDGDWMAGLSEISPGVGVLTYRFRYYVDDKTFDSKDRKNWYAFRGPLAKLQKFTKKVAESMAKERGGSFYELLRGGRSLQEFIEEYSHAPFVTIKTVTQEEFDREIQAGVADSLPEQCGGQ